MELTFQWKITGLKKIEKVGEKTDVVVHVHWMCIGTDSEGNKGVHESSSPVQSPIGTDTFVPFEELTEEMVIDWIKNYIKSIPNYESNITDSIKKQINSIKNPISDVSMFPWGGTPTVGTQPSTSV